MNIIELLQEAHKTQDWGFVEDALALLGSPVTSEVKQPKTSEGKKQPAPKPVKKAGRPKKEVVQATPFVDDNFRVKNKKADTEGWEEVKLGRKNTWTDTKEDLKEEKRFKGPDGKWYKNSDEFFKKNVYNSTRTSTKREPVKKVQVTCDRCGDSESLYESSIVYKDPEEGVWYCNSCSGKGV